MGRVDKLIKSSVFALCLQIVTLITGLIVPGIMLSTYGSEINGLISSISQFIAYFNVVEAGLASASVYALYKPIADNSKNEINGILAATNRFYKISGYIFVSLTLAFSIIYPQFIHTKSMSYVELSLLILVLSTSGTLEFFTMGKYRALLTADQKQYILSVASIVSILLNTILIIIFSKLGVSVLVLRFICLFAVFSRSIILSLYVKHNYKYINYKVKPNSKALNTRYTVLINEIFGTLHVASPIIIITSLLSLELVSVYTIFNLVVNGINSLISFFVTALSSLLGEMVAKKEWEIVKKVYNEFEFIYYTFLMTITMCTMELIIPFIKIYTSGINDVSYNRPLFAILCVLAGMTANIYTPQAILVRAGGKFRETKKQTIVQGCITLILGIILTSKMGLVGMCLAIIISNIYRICILINGIERDMLKECVNTTIIRIIKMCIGLVLGMIIFNNIEIFVEMKSGLDNYLSWFLYAVFFGLYSVIFSLLVNIIGEKNTVKDLGIRIKSNLNRRMKRQ